MKTQRLLQALTDIDDAAIEAAHPVHDRPHSHFRAVWAAAAALAVTAAALTAVAWPRVTAPVTPPEGLPSETAPTTPPEGLPSETAPTTPQEGWPIKYVEVFESVGEIAIVKRWEEKTPAERFPEMFIDTSAYSVGNAELPPEKVGAPLGTATLRGYDIYTDTIHEIGATYYAIDGINPLCAVAVQLEGETVWRPYSDPWYTPDTLAQFISDLNLREHLTTASVWYRPDRRTVEFEGLSTETVWDLLLSDGTPTNINIEHPDNVMTVSVSLPLLGIENVSLAVTADGYLTTNLLGTRKSFYIGEEATTAFVTYVLEHCEGSEIVYVHPDTDTPIPESSPEKTVTMQSTAYTAP